MMIPSSGVDLTGTVCNKVGTSYTAFRYGQTVSLLGAAGVDASLEPPAAMLCIEVRILQWSSSGEHLVSNSMLASQ